MLRHGAGWEQGQELANLLQSFISPLEVCRDRVPLGLDHPGTHGPFLVGLRLAKRLSTVVREKWRADQLTRLEEQGRLTLAIWDESVDEGLPGVQAHQARPPRWARRPLAPPCAGGPPERGGNRPHLSQPPKAGRRVVGDMHPCLATSPVQGPPAR